ncbi:siderophore ABC transporter substrate-binding protein [Tenuibacillus multivorans]|uniref:Iron complex transport system substrate-binding protein n=1 Tax=Tenuibacillus multivorans TaxID=237069 RepID=A0A1H0AY78_9BACI|nr:siderophore ABC transporter substrate-binding protein [Tenuibacillus multivorans]GEL77614.1 putative ABC transporter solute-binding protein YclQ [Tenuibacillus multivorans]SDN38430.1 iron complex transport system substrate-binding protein [Tenuibacillus multivorans]
MKKLMLSLSVLAIVLLAACGTEDTEAVSGDTIEIEHPLDTIEVEKNPEKVVVFDFGMLDTLKQLDVSVAGVPKDSLPSYLSEYDDENIEHVGGLKEPDFEAIHAMDPDLIIISGRQMDLYEDFKEIAPTLYVELDAERYMDSFKHNAKLAGKIFDKQEQVESELAEIETLVEELQAKTESSDKTGLITLATGGKVSTYGPGSRFGFIHNVFGVKPADDSIEVATHGQNISFEFIVEKDPDYLYVIDRDAVVNGEPAAKDTIENELVMNTTAYQNDQIIYLDPNYWYLSGGGLISTKEMIKEIKQTFD